MRLTPSIHVPTAPTSNLPRRRRGLSIPEVLISLTITAMVLTAMSSAFIASSQAITANDRYFRASQGARVCLAQVTMQVRRSKQVLLVNSTQLKLTCFDNVIRVWNIVAPTSSQPGSLTMTDLSSGATYTLCNDLAVAQFGFQTGPDSNNSTVVTQVGLNLTVQLGNNTVRMASAASPRSSQRWE